MSEDILQFVEPIFRFCLKRLSSRTDAEDLSQEIILCVLQGIKRGHIDNLNGYIWQVAHNRYARMIQTRKGERTVLCGYEQLPDFSDEEAETETLEKEQLIFNALHTLSAMYRDIMVDFYVRRFNTYAIAKQYGITVETVKWRLHAGREKIRERMNRMEKNYERVKMHLLPNGSFEIHEYLGSQMQKAITKVCYTSPLTLEEISLATGIPTLYLEDTLDYMVWGDAIEKIGSKYATNFIITPSDTVNTYLTNEVVSTVTDIILNYILSTESTVREIGFYGNHFPLADLLHIMIPKIILELSGNTGQQPFPPHKDGGFGWYIIHEGIESLDWRFSEVQGFTYGSQKESAGRFTYFWTGDTVSKDLIRFLANKAGFFPHAVGDDYVLSFNNDEDKALAILFGLCESCGGKLMPSIPVFFSEEEYKRFNIWAKNCNSIKPEWSKWIDALKATYKSFTPKRLSEQIIGNVNSQSFNLNAYVIKELQKRGLASVADKSKIFTNNLLMVR